MRAAVRCVPWARAPASAFGTARAKLFQAPMQRHWPPMSPSPLRRCSAFSAPGTKTQYSRLFRLGESLDAHRFGDRARRRAQAGPPSPRGSFGVSDERGADMMHAIPNRKRLPPLRVGVGGPVGSGKTTLVKCSARPCVSAGTWSSSPMTSTQEDQRLLTVAGALAPSASWASRPVAARTLPSRGLLDQPRSRGPHARQVPRRRHRLRRKRGDNLAATFSPELGDLTIYGLTSPPAKIPRKGGPGITRATSSSSTRPTSRPMWAPTLDIMRSDTAHAAGQAW